MKINMLKSLLLLALVVMVSTPVSSVEPAPKPKPEPKPSVDLPAGQAGPLAGQTGLKAVWKLIHGCNARYEKLTGYSCTFRRQERVEGMLRPVQVMAMKFRKPASVHMVWQNGLMKNCQVIYVADKNEGKMLVYTGNLPAFRKVFRISPTSVEARRESSHSIREAGMGYLCVRMLEQFKKAEAEGILEAEYLGIKELHGRKAWHIMRTLKGGQRREWNIDVELMLPTRVAIYDKKGKLLEAYGYRDVKLNPGLKDDDFDPEKVFF